MGIQVLVIAMSCFRLGLAMIARDESHDEAVGFGKTEDFGMANDATLAPVNTIAELLELKQFEARDYWQPAASREIEDLRAPGFWAKLTQTPLSIRRNAPRLDEHREEILEEIARDDRKRPLLTANEAEVNDSSVQPPARTNSGTSIIFWLFCGRCWNAFSSGRSHEMGSFIA